MAWFTPAGVRVLSGARPIFARSMSRGRFYVRLESGEWPLLNDLEGAPPFDAAVISDRYLAPYPDGHPQEDESADRLADAVDGVNRPFSVDLDTARLQHPASVVRQSARSALRPVASVLALPLTVEELRSADAVSALVDAAQISQVRAGAFAAPYLEVDGPDDPRQQINIELLRASRQLAGGRPLISYLQVLHSTLVSGDALKAAIQLVPHADVIAVRARRVDPANVRPEQARRLIELVASLALREVRVVADCAGPAGPPLVAAGADAFSAGTRFFHTVPSDLHPTIGGGGGAPLSTIVPLADKPRVFAVGDATDNATTRLENLRVMQAAARQAGMMGPDYAELLASSGRAQGAVWAAELRRLQIRAA
jgi:hypothetical protein